MSPNGRAGHYRLRARFLLEWRDMKLVSLNTWGGSGGKENLLDFFKRHKDVDIFCLQEIWNGGDEMAGRLAGGVPLARIQTTLFSDIAKVLEGHVPYFRPQIKDHYGLAMFVRKTLDLRKEGDIFVYKDKGYIHKDDFGDHARNLQYATIETNNGLRTIMNFHGIWTTQPEGKGKHDIPDRLLQSDNIVRFAKDLPDPYVLCGDFNLLPTTMSIKKLEDAGMRNLIKEYGVTSTRSSFYKKSERFADYAFTSPGIKVNDFKVLPDEVSDHLALYLDFE